ncbi:hypothetical protein ADICYQ_1258 [Cyclobacterium qasimii M12-11B]|uniref:Uncharacterized protein n=1 Tax=Cyclobacterium qasimii M12-11B TaxID=641524 RepID=S7VJZ5_9BACT|nr:hypothetical protein ADICYQ_1258 [Cyclobacterium qasimii M12-11B]
MYVLHNDTCHTGSPKIPDGIPMAFSILQFAFLGGIDDDAPVRSGSFRNSGSYARP